jgi:saccharopine dehydrogenase-like NADP-dependent oxidoreductase
VSFDLLYHLNIALLTFDSRWSCYQAGGKIGTFLVKALLASTAPKFAITALNRPTSNYSPPEDIDTSSLNVVKVDFGDDAALIKVLKGQDAVILAFAAGPELKSTSISIIDASIEAGVKWIMPSDFGK